MNIQLRELQIFYSIFFLFLLPDESIDDFAYNDQPAGFADDLPIQYQTYAYLSKLAPESVGARSRVRRNWYIRRGVYDECCRKPCSINELKSYCKNKTN